MDSESEENGEEIYDEVITDVRYPNERGTVYAVRRVEQGDRRIEWKVGHINGTYAEAVDLYYQGDQIDESLLREMPENGPDGMYKDSTFQELLDSEMKVEDGKLTIKEVYDADGIDAVEWAAGKIETAFEAETILDEWWIEPLSWVGADE